MKPLGPVVLSLLVLAAAAGLPAQAPVSSAPGPVAAGRKLGRALLARLEAEAVRLRPGSFGLETAGTEFGPGLQGLGESLASRGFLMARPGQAQVLRLRLRAEPWEGGGRLVLETLEPPLGLQVVHWEEKPWVESPRPEQFRLHGPWAGDGPEALRLAAEEAWRQALIRVSPRLPWRPWRAAAFRPEPAPAAFVADSFLEIESTRVGTLSRAWLLLAPEEVQERILRARLRSEDRRWLALLAGSGLAGLALVVLAARLDWASRGYFTWRIRALCLFFWAGVCAGLLVVL